MLLGLLANGLLGWWWADAVAALVIGAFAIRGGIEAWNGDACATPIGEFFDSDADARRTGDRC